MGRINLAQRIEQYNREQSGRAVGMGIAALLMWAAWYGAVYGLAWFVMNLLIEDGFDYRWWMPHTVALGAVLFLVLCTIPFLANSDATIDEPDEPGALDMIFTGGQQAAGEALFAFLMVIPKVTSESWHALRGRGRLSEEELRVGQRIVDKLYDGNNWLPAEQFARSPDLAVLAKLLKMGFVWSREHHGRYLVRLDPSLMP